MKSLQFNKSYTDKTLYIHSPYTDEETIIMQTILIDWNGNITWLVIANIYYYRNIKQIFWHLLLAVQYRAYFKLRHTTIFIYIYNLILLL